MPAGATPDWSFPIPGPAWRVPWPRSPLRAAFAFKRWFSVLNSGDRYTVKTPDHADLPPADEQTGQRNGYFVVYNDRAIPRYISVDNVAALEHKLASNGE